MYSKISVYFNGKLFFATRPKSITSIGDLIKVFNVLNRKFPDEEGYTIEVQYSILIFTRENWQALMDFQNKIRSFLSE